MTKWIALPAALVAAAALTVSVEAAPKAANSNGAKTTKTTTKAPSTTTTTKGASQAKGASPKSTTAPKSTSAKADHSGGSKAKGPKSTTAGTSTTAKGNGSSKKASSTTTASTTIAAPGPTTTWEPTNPVAAKLMTKPNQLAKLKAVLPAGTDINAATAGFKNFGQLNAAVNVSQNLGIEFADLKAAMTGITLEGQKTGEPTKSLGQAIQQFRPGVDSEAEATAATAQATREAGQ
jgi:hypothetical protein